MSKRSTLAPLFSLTNLKGLTNGDSELMNEFNRVFLQNTIETDLPNLKECCEKGDFEGIRWYTHKIKPSVDLYSMDSISETVRKAEKLATQFTDLDLIRSLVHEILSVMDVVEGEIRAICQ
ncbi:MAG: hypothetical protein HKN32_01145 [Flavobacteriales bacterium]|nr:hypothetical protein [Flavobacteriales bacterium]